MIDKDVIENSIEDLLKKSTEDGLSATLTNLFGTSLSGAAIATGTAGTATLNPALIGVAGVLFLVHIGLSKVKNDKSKKIQKQINTRWQSLFSHLQRDHITELDKLLEGNLQNKKIIELGHTLLGISQEHQGSLEELESKFALNELQLDQWTDYLSTNIDNISEGIQYLQQGIEGINSNINKSTDDIKESIREGFTEQKQDVRDIIQEEVNKIIIPPKFDSKITPSNHLTINLNIATMGALGEDALNQLTDSLQKQISSKDIGGKSHYIGDSISKNIFDLFNKAQCQLTYKNYTEALNLSKELEVYAEGLKVYGITPYIQVLLARLNINYYEANLKQDMQYLKKAKELLQNAESTAHGDLFDRIEALKAIVTDFEGNGSILEILNAKTNPYAMRARIATLCKEKKYTDAVTLIEEQEKVHEYWAESAIIAYLFVGQDEIADQILKEMKKTSDYSFIIICSQKYAEILSLRIAKPQPQASEIDAEKILCLLHPVLEESTRTKNIQGIFQVATEIALQVNLLLGNSEEIKRYSKMLLAHTPIPFIVLECILRQYIQPPENILKRIRNEHKTNINAHLLAAAIQIQCFNEPVKAFLALKKVAKLAETEQEKEALLHCLLDLWQQLDEKLSEDCDNLAMTLCEPESLSAIKFKAGKYLRNNQPDKVLELLQNQPETDPVILQMKGNAYWQKNQLADAAECFKNAGELVNSPEMYHKAGDFYLQSKKEPKAIECYEKSIYLQPNNIIVRSNLIDIYTRTYIDLKKALEHLIALNFLQPNDSKVLINIATCYTRLFEPEKSLEYYNQACKVDKPMLAAVAGKAELLIAMKREDEAFTHLEAFKEQFETDSDFLLVYMNAAYYAGFDDKADQVMKSILASQEKGEINEEIIQMIPAEKGMEMFKENAQQTNETNKNIHEKMLQGQFPWLWAESTNRNKNFYWGWIRRTQKLSWLFEAPINWANFTIYSTNGFHAQKDYDKRISLLPIKSPTAKSTIVADISALITLYQLNLLDTATEYFDKIIIPEEYLKTVLTQGKEVLLHQKSTYINAMRIKDFCGSGNISILPKNQKDDNIIRVDEYYSEKTAKKLYHIRDIIESLFASGALEENLYQKALKVSSKPKTLTENNILQYKQKIQIEYSTLRTFADLNLLGQICDFFNIWISSDSNDENNQIIRGVRNQNDCIDKYYDLWRRLKADPKVEFIRAVKTVEEKENHDPIIESVLLATNIARANNYPLLADDRVLQTLRFNESLDMQFAAFGTDALILDLMHSKILSKKDSLDALLKLMKWRYRFIVMPPELLKEAALMYSNYPPGKILKQIAEYVQECMRDPGLFTGIEKTKMRESMAIRLYLTWSSNITEFITLLWKDKSINLESAEKLTNWAINELLPSPPRSFHGNQKRNVEALTLRQILTKILIYAWALKDNARIKKAMKVIKECFNLNDKEYAKTIIDILNDVAKTIPVNADKKTIEANVVMQERIMAIAFSHIKTIGVRTLTSLQNLHLTDKKVDPIGHDIDPEILRNPIHDRRIALPPGPLLVYRAKDKKENIIIETKSFFCSTLLKIRKAILEYYEHMISGNNLQITPKTANIFMTERENFLSNKNSTWRPASIAIYDALNDDALICLAGVNQVLQTELKIKDFLHSYVPEILHPEISSIDSIPLEIIDLEREHDKIKKLISDIINNNETLSDVCQNYYHKFGHIPLATEFSLAQVAKTWIDKNKKQEVWDEIWTWADNTSNISGFKFFKLPLLVFLLFAHFSDIDNLAAKLSPKKFLFLPELNF